MPLSTVLKINACFSFLCGVSCLLFSGPIAALIGDIPPGLMMAIGIGLMVFAADVFWISRQLPQAKRRANVIFWADVAWVLLTPVVIVLVADKLSSTGIMILIDIAIVVGILALFEWRGIKKLTIERKLLTV